MNVVRGYALFALGPLVVLVACGTETGRGITATTLNASQQAKFSDWSEPVSLGPIVNSPFLDQQPSVSKDGLTLYFGSNRGGAGAPGSIDLWISQRHCLECPWGPPVNLGPTVNSSTSNDNAPRQSRDAHWLFFNSLRPEGSAGTSDIWVSYREAVHDDFGWQAPVNLGPGVNTALREGPGSFFANDEGGVPQLYFTRGGTTVPDPTDIYLSVRTADGLWGPAVPVVELNDPAGRNDGSPSVTHTGLEVYFNSNRTGATHIWCATRESVRDPWSPPVELGLPINSVPTSDPFIHSHGRTETLYFVRNVPGNNLDLFMSTRTRLGRNEVP